MSSMSLMMIGLFLLECWSLANRSRIQCQEELYGQGWPMSSISLVRNPQCPPSHWWWRGVSWHTSNHTRKLKFGTQVGNHIWRTFEMSKMTHVLNISGQEPSMSSESLMMSGVSWRTSNHGRNSKFGTHIWRHKSSQTIKSLDRRPSKAVLRRS